MYSVYGDGKCIYNDIHASDMVNAVSPKLTLADNTAGSLEITLPVGNIGYDILERLSSEIVVKRYDNEIWSGRIISERKNFQNSRVLTCEGELAYLNDTTQQPNEYSDVEVYDFIEAILIEHNNKVADSKKFYIGAVTMKGTVSAETNDESTLSIINDVLINDLGGHIVVRKAVENGVTKRYLDYYADYINTNSQEIRFGSNLLDFTIDWDMSELATVVLPRGKKANSSSSDDYVYVTSVNNGSRYVQSGDAVKKYGWIEVVVDWEYISDPTELLTVAQKYLQEEQFDEMVIEASALDLRYLSSDVQPIALLDQVRCISRPHGMDKIFPVTKLSIQLDKPDSAKYTLGSKSKTNTLTGTIRAENEEILKRVENMPNEESILQKAKDNATQIMNLATQGYVTIIQSDTGSEALVVSADKTYNPITGYWSDSTRLWKWNINGLGYSTDGGRTFGLAMTMNGAIVADYITTGTMSADRIRTGILQDENQNTVWNLTTGVLTMKKGSISLGNKFSVTDDGYLIAEYGKIGGFTITADSIYNSTLNMNSRGFSLYSDAKLLGSYGTSTWGLQPDIHGLDVNMEHNTGYISWSHLDNASDSSYTIKLMYTAEKLLKNDGGYFAPNRVHLGCNLDGNNWSAYNLFIDPYSGGAEDGMTLDDGNYVSLLTSDGYINCRIVGGFILG